MGCGASIDGLKCGNCGRYVGLEEYGYRLERATKNYMLYEGENPILVFTSLGSKTQRQIAEKTGAPINVVELAFAKLVDAETHIEQLEDEETEIVEKYRPSIITGEFIAEQIWDGKSAPQYAIKRFDEEKISYETSISLGECDNKERDIVYHPVYNDHLLTGMVTVPTEPVKTTFGETISEAFDYLGQTDFFDPCGKVEQVKLGGMVSFGSWFLDRMKPRLEIPVAGVGRYASLLPIRGPSETGKNRLANLYRFLSYRPFFAQSTARIPSLFRPLALWKGTLVMDEADFYKTGPQADIIQFLNCRATGSPIPRQNPDKGSESQVFESFGITILTQRQYFDDNATESRSIPFYTEKTSLKIPTIELDEVVKWGLRLQNKLLYLRLFFWNQVEIDKRYWIKTISDHRLNAGLLPAISLSKFDPEITNIIINCVAPIQLAKKRVKANSYDGRIINEIWNKLNEGLYHVSNLRYCVLDELKTHEDEDGAVTNEIPIALTTSKLKERTGIGYKNIRKSLNSLNIAPSDAPARARIGKYSTRPIWFIPDKLEKYLREFVLQYPENELYEKINLDVPDVPDVPRIYPPELSGDVTKDGENTTQPEDYTHKEVEHAEQVEQNNPAHTSSEIATFLEVLKDAIQVGSLWPRIYFENRGHSREKAENIVKELHSSGKIVMLKGGSWEISK